MHWERVEKGFDDLRPKRIVSGADPLLTIMTPSRPPFHKVREDLPVSERFKTGLHQEPILRHYEELAEDEGDDHLHRGNISA